MIYYLNLRYGFKKSLFFFILKHLRRLSLLPHPRLSRRPRRLSRRLPPQGAGLSSYLTWSFWLSSSYCFNKWSMKLSQIKNQNIWKYNFIDDFFLHRYQCSNVNFIHGVKKWNSNGFIKINVFLWGNYMISWNLNKQWQTVSSKCVLSL